MGYFRKTLERRTFSEDRYYILIKKQKAGTAKLDELIELDEIVNRVPDIREKVIMENFVDNTPDEFNNDSGIENNISISHLKRPNLWNRVGSFLHRIFTTQISVIKTGQVTPVF